MIDLENDPELYNALRTLALGATQEEVGKDSNGNSKLFKKKIPPNFDAIKYIYENKSSQISNGLREWRPNDCKH